MFSCMLVMMHAMCLVREVYIFTHFCRPARMRTSERLRLPLCCQSQPGRRLAAETYLPCVVVYRGTYVVGREPALLQPVLTVVLCCVVDLSVAQRQQPMANGGQSAEEKIPTVNVSMDSTNGRKSEGSC